MLMTYEIIIYMQLLDALKILADTKENQTIYLDRIGTSPSTDELALEFCSAYEVFKGKLEEGSNDISFETNLLKKAEEIYSLFAKMSNISDNDFWKISSLNHTEWNQIRKLAREITGGGDTVDICSIR